MLVALIMFRLRQFIALRMFMSMSIRRKSFLVQVCKPYALMLGILLIAGLCCKKNGQDQANTMSGLGGEEEKGTIRLPLLYLELILGIEFEV